MSIEQLDQPTAAETFPPATWRVIIEDAPRSGAGNMAVDQALAEACAAGEAAPTLRFYRWNPPAVSLGRHQPAAEIDFEAAAARGYDVVRRTTGGRAILHVDELTYSVAAPKDEQRVRGGVMDAYLRLSNALLAGLQNVGLMANKAGGDVRAGKEVSAACFEAPSAYEITAGGRKLLGSAQSRRAGYVLQHGSLPLMGNIARLIDVLNLPPHELDALRTQLRDRAQTLEQAMTLVNGSPPPDTMLQFESVAKGLCHGFETILNITLEPGTLTPGETRRTAELIREKYADAEWTHSR